MIDGVYPSQIKDRQIMRNSHYRNLQQIVNHKTGNKTPMFAPDILKISRNRRFNHDNWKSHHKNQYDKAILRRNASIYDRLSKIAVQKSRYHRFRTQQAPQQRDPLLHHNYLYQCQRRYTKIQKNNQLIASKILNVQANFSHKKQISAFKETQMNVTRLQKFQRQKRLERVISKSLNSHKNPLTITTQRLKNMPKIQKDNASNDFSVSSHKKNQSAIVITTNQHSP